MQKTIRNTETEKRVLTAFAGEAQARNRYTFFASKAKKDGYEQIAALFLETAEQEKEHAKLFFKQLEGGAVEIQAMFPAGIIASTRDNLLAAANGENEEWTQAYPASAQIAADEGFSAIADLFLKIATIEAYHEKRFRYFVESIDGGKVFVRKEPTQWQCRNCGYIHEGAAAPDLCPACAHPRAYFEATTMRYGQ
jgi:rubrerythrin